VPTTAGASSATQHCEQSEASLVAERASGPPSEQGENLMRGGKSPVRSTITPCESN